jgi:hypothetical protein
MALARSVSVCGLVGACVDTEAEACVHVWLGALGFTVHIYPDSGTGRQQQSTMHI